LPTGLAPPPRGPWHHYVVVGCPGLRRLVANPLRSAPGTGDDDRPAARDAFTHPLRSLAGTRDDDGPAANAAGASARAGTILDQLDTLIGRVGRNLPRGRIGVARLSKQRRPDGDSGQEDEYTRLWHCCLLRLGWTQSIITPAGRAESICPRLPPLGVGGLGGAGGARLRHARDGSKPNLASGFRRNTTNCRDSL
jgi:hypothetical protein